MERPKKSINSQTLSLAIQTLLMDKTLVILLGPTGVGKTDLSIDLATLLKTEIISCDSRQIFQEMNIGTAAPDQKTLETIPHHFIRTHSIHDPYNARRFELDGLQKLEQLFKTKDHVLMTGGSMLYIDALVNGLDDLPNIDPELRTRLMSRLSAEGLEPLLAQLQSLDPSYYNEVDRKNPKRIVHALEVCLTTGKPFSDLRTNKIQKRSFKIIKIGLNCDRAILHNRINDRVDKMFKDGLEQEAKELYEFRSLNSLNTVGYRELFDYFDGTITMAQANEKIKANTRKYARKQLTWFRRDPEIVWFSPDQKGKIIDYLRSNLKL